jgi:hypothetical protein
MNEGEEAEGECNQAVVRFYAVLRRITASFRMVFGSFLIPMMSDVSRKWLTGARHLDMRLNMRLLYHGAMHP